jgi:hypothetical protein
LQNREELRQKGHDWSKKMMCSQRGKISFSEGRGVKYIFGPKYRHPEKQKTRA